MASTRFDWDSDKDAENQRRDGIAFIRAQYAFADPQRVIARDLAHSSSEERFTVSARLMAGLSRCDSPIAPR